MVRPDILLKDYFCVTKKFLLFNMVSRNLKVKYRRSFLGMFWTILVPVASASVYYAVFKVIMNVQKPNYMVLILAGVMVWNYFAQTVSEGVTHYVDHQGLITKISVPIQIFNFTTSTTNMVTLLITVPLVFLVAMIQPTELNWGILFLPYFLLCLFLITYACSIFLAVSYVYFRDLRQVVMIALQLFFYGTPILYTIDMIPERARWILYVNPMGILVPAVQNCFTGALSWTPELFLTPLAWAIGFSAVALVFLNRFRKLVVEVL